MRLGADEDVQDALAQAYAYLNRRDRTEAEVRARLEQRGVGSAAVEQALAELADQGVVDDARYARLFVEDKRRLEEWGSDRIRRALRSRGIDRALIEQALEAGSAALTADGLHVFGDAAARTADGLHVFGDAPAETEFDRALALLRRRFPVPPVDRRERDRALGVLLRKGYDSDLAVDALAAHARSAEAAP